MNKPKVVILGAGVAGLGAAFHLAKRGFAQISVLEQSNNIGGNAGSFELAGISVDYGSHRLHPTCDPAILLDIKKLLNDDLLNRPRHGRIHLQGRWIHFPLKPMDLLFRLQPTFSLNVIKDIFYKILPGRKISVTSEDFCSVLKRGLGNTICRYFYFPYAFKMWGLTAEKLSAIQARRRISAGSMMKMFQKILSAVPGIRPHMSGRFFYPRKGFGQISEYLFNACNELGVKFHLNAQLKTIHICESDSNKTSEIYFEKEGKENKMYADHIWSTIPIPVLVNYLRPGVPEMILEAANNLEYRSMILIYLVLKQNRFSEYDAHYFPEIEIPFTRLSEPKNYSNSYRDLDRTVLCAELPCFTSDPEWNMTDEDLGKLVLKGLDKAGIPIMAPIEQIITKRLQYAYPIYKAGFEKFFDCVENWLDQIGGLLTFGRQGLFAHDNTHHALFMGYSAADCLEENGRFDYEKWQNFKQIFDTHVVED